METWSIVLSQLLLLQIFTLTSLQPTDVIDIQGKGTVTCNDDGDDDVRRQVMQLLEQMNELKAQTDAHTECPADFIHVPAVNGCYKVLLSNLAWQSAGQRCRTLNKHAHLLVVDNIAEQQAIVNMLALYYHNAATLRNCTTENRGGVHLWTAGQRVDPSKSTPFVWKMTSASGDRTDTSHMAYNNWMTSSSPFGQQPDYANNNEACLSLIKNDQFNWNDDMCSAQYCSLCEIDIRL